MEQLQDIKIFWKIFLALLLIGLVSTLSISSLSYVLGEKTLKKEAFRKLTAIREAKANHIEHEMREIRGQVTTFAEDFMVVQAMKDFEEGFAALGEEAAADPGAVAKAEEELKEFYGKKFLPHLHADAAPPLSAEELLPSTPAAILLQHRYIAANSNPVGEKQLLTAAGDNSPYSQIHHRYHRVFLNFRNKFRYYDIFLIDARSGRIVYSVAKEVDLGKSVTEPIFRNTNLAATFRKSVGAPRDFQHLADFANYYPSHNAPASFISAPIFDHDEKIGVLVFQLPIDRINSIMTNDQRWEDIGLGKSGETYLVGGDFTLRSQSRFFLTDKERYLKAIAGSGMTPPNVIEKIRALNTGVGLQPVKTLGARMALAGKSGDMIFNDYRNIPVLASFQPLKIGDVRWALLSKIDRAEAQQPIHQLEIMIAASFAGLLLLTIIFARFVSRFIAKPLVSLADLMAEVENSGDLSLRLARVQNDEIGSTARNFHSLLERWKSTLIAVRDNTQKLLAGEDCGQNGTVTPFSDKDVLGVALSEMTEALNRYHRENAAKGWRDEGQARLNDLLRSEQSPEGLADKVLLFLAHYLKAQMGVFYLSNADGTVSMAASYAFPAHRRRTTAIEPGDGVVGQVVVEMRPILLADVGEEYAPVQSGTGAERPKNIMVAPLLTNDHLEGVIELATIHVFTPLQLEFLQLVAENIAIAIASAKSRIRNQELLEYTQHQAEKLQNQTEELRNQTEELQNQTAELEAQQEQLRITNDELAQRSRLLEEQRNEIADHNTRLEEARKLLELKAV
ncbi:MAG: GAF domain-containing protein, partial [Desulfobulbaceae bacterium]|nr:GAF domain-containing protein [Desulfobulbaceae bacterium]